MSYCISSFTGAPYSTATTLKWWDVQSPNPQTNPADALRSYPEDPDWLNGFSVSHGDGGTPHVIFRALSGLRNNITYIHLSWIVLVDINLTAGNISGDGVDMLLANGGEGIIIKLRLPTTSSTDTTNEKRRPPSIQCKRYTGGAEGVALGGDPTYVVETARCWIDYLPLSKSPKVKWTFQIAVPVDANLFDGVTNPPPTVSLPIGSAFKFWYNVQTVNYVDQSNQQLTAMYPWPQKNIYPPATGGTIPIDPNFKPAELVVQPNSSAVCEPGITLNQSGIKVMDVSGTTDRNLTIAVDLEKDSNGNYVNNPPRHDLPKYQNMFTASPGIPMGMLGDAGKIRGRFRLANWGSQSGTVTQDSWKIIPNGDSVAYSTTNNRLELPWPRTTLDPGYETNFFLDLVNGIRNGSRDPHQCILIELFATDSSLTFTKSSEFNNTRFVQASIFQEDAEISVVGLQPVSPQPRDVYLYLDAQNMPVVVTRDDGPEWGPAPTKRLIPSYYIHAWHDTGLTRKLEDGTVQRILAPQTSFGYVVFHEGQLYGWDTRLYGAKKLTENFYQLQVQNNGAARVRVGIQGRETPTTVPLPPDSATGCLFALAEWLDTKGPVGRFAAMLVRLIARLIGQAA